MTKSNLIKAAFEKNVTVLSRNPSLAQKKGRVKARALEGLACEIESGPWKLKVDMPKAVGGDESAPKPGVLEAGALGSCMVIMIKMWAAKNEVPIDGVEVDVEFDADVRYLFGIGDAPTHWKGIRYSVTVESTAPEEDVMQVLNAAHRQSHVRGDFEHAFEVGRNVNIISPISQEKTNRVS